MTLGQQEQRLQDVLAVLDAARVPPAQGRAVSGALRGLADQQADLDRLLTEMCRDLTDVIGLLGTLEAEDEEQARARGEMLGHLRGDLSQMRTAHRAVQQLAGTTYLSFYALL
ncbi:hypothetical protein [uncultured Deinococcus sp.]|uniref:hypothetical protein n=1 Tax=uncultured Deinococcus sp. TaxID=158789 RepID=UPI0025899512|nr:hypothetical protein [uncultured Deinococcus sp.]